MTSLRPRLGPSRSPALIATLAICAVLVMLGAAQSSAAIYNSNPSCVDELLQPYNSPNYSDRCMGGFYQVTQVAGFNTPNDYNRCAIAKNSSNGAGGDAIPAACGTGSVITPCYTVAFHYPGIVDHGPYAHHGYYSIFATSTADC